MAGGFVITNDGVKNAIVTGANRGIGKEIVQLFAKNGINVWACARKKDEAFESEMDLISKQNDVWIKPVYFDLKDELETKMSIQSIVKEKKTIDILVNNAGIPHGGTLTMTSMESLKEVFQINYFSQVLIMQLVARQMMKQKSGNIINISSIGGVEVGPGYLAYGSSKAALIYATKTISKELGKYGIRVNAVAPGITETRMGNYKTQEEIEKSINRCSLHRKAEPIEIAKCVLFLASEDSSFITGQTLIVDGGRICV